MQLPIHLTNLTQMTIIFFLETCQWIAIKEYFQTSNLKPFGYLRWMPVNLGYIIITYISAEKYVTANVIKSFEDHKDLNQVMAEQTMC